MGFRDTICNPSIDYINGYGTIHRVYCVYWNVCKEQEAIQEKRGLLPLETHYIRDPLPRADSIRLKHKALLLTYEMKKGK
jgi:hypothetical protein